MNNEISIAQDGSGAMRLPSSGALQESNQSLDRSGMPEVGASEVSEQPSRQILRRMLEAATRFLRRSDKPGVYSPYAEEGFLGPVSDELSEIVKRAKARGLKGLILEQPTRWIFKDEINHTRNMFAGLQNVLNQLNLPISAHPIFKPDSMKPREIPQDMILFSYHSALATVPREDVLDWEVSNRIARIKESYLPPFFTFDRTGYSGWAELSRSRERFEESFLIDPDSALEFASAFRRWVQEQKVSKYDQPQEAKFKLDRPYVFYGMQVAKDTVMEWARLRYDVLLPELVRCSHDSQVPLVIKRHPRCTDKAVGKKLAELSEEHNVYVVDADVHSLIEGAQSVIVINSGVGMEALIQGKPVYSTGNSDYRWATKEVYDPFELMEAFTDPQPRLSAVEHAQFLSFYFQHYCMNARDQRSIEAHVANAFQRWIDNTPEQFRLF